MNDLEQEEALRRLLTEAVEPIQPAPDAQARLQRRLRIGREPRKRFWERAGFGWAATGLATAGVIVLAVLFVHVRGADSSKSSSGSSAVSNPAAQPQSAAAGSSTTRAPSQSFPVVTSDLDGDGRADSLTVVGGNLVAELTKDGHQSVALPSNGLGNSILGFTRLQFYAAGAGQVALIRLGDHSGAAHYVVVAVAAGKLSVLQIGSGPALLTVDAAHGFGCNDEELVVSGVSAAYVIKGDQLVASPRLRAVTTPVARITGC